jgi:hypothetical protein
VSKLSGEALLNPLLLHILLPVIHPFLIFYGALTPIPSLYVPRTNTNTSSSSSSSSFQSPFPYDIVSLISSLSVLPISPTLLNSLNISLPSSTSQQTTPLGLLTSLSLPQFESFLSALINPQTNFSNLFHPVIHPYANATRSLLQQAIALSNNSSNSPPPPAISLITLTETSSSLASFSTLTKAPLACFFPRFYVNASAPAPEFPLLLPVLNNHYLLARVKRLVEVEREIYDCVYAFIQNEEFFINRQVRDICRYRYA